MIVTDDDWPSRVAVIVSLPSVKESSTIGIEKDAELLFTVTDPVRLCPEISAVEIPERE